MKARLAVLDTPDVDGGRSAKLDLRPLQIAYLGSSQAMPKSSQDQRSVPVAIPPLPRFFDQLFDLGRRQIFAGTKLGIWQA